MNDELYTKIFVDFNSDSESLVALISECLPGRPEIAGTVVGRHCEVDVFTNDSADPARKSDPKGGFLFYSFFLDVTRIEGADRVAYVAEITHLLEALWSRHLKAVAACDFEDELPRRGGSGRQTGA